MYLAAATPEYLTRQDYQAPVYRNILDILKSVEYMNGRVFTSAMVDALKGAISPSFAGFAINKTGVQSRFAGVYLIATELAGMPAAQAQALIASLDAGQSAPYQAFQNRYSSGALYPGHRVYIVSDIQDEIETLVREMNRVRLPLPTDLRHWARRVEDLAHELVPGSYRPPRPFQAPTIATATGMQAYELARQAAQMKTWLPQMRLKLHKEIAKANLRGKIGAIDLELTPSIRAIDAAKSLATVTAIEKRESAKIAIAKKTAGAGRKTVPSAASRAKSGVKTVSSGLDTRLTASATPGASPAARDTLASASLKGAIGAAAFVGAMYWLFLR